MRQPHLVTGRFGPRITISLLALVAAAAMMGHAARAADAGEQSAQATAAKEVEAAARDVVDAYATNDHKRYFGRMADDISIWSGGRQDRVTKKGYMDSWVANIEKGGGIAKGAIQDLRVQVSPSGDAGIATFYMPVTSRVPPGSANPARDIHYNITHVWFKRNGRWEMTHYYWSTWTPGGARGNTPTSGQTSPQGGGSTPTPGAGGR
jgi:ketosteroid isomerase-like protein